LTDYITYGIDGYRGDTVKHTDETVWADFKTQCDYALKLGRSTKVNNSFFTPLLKFTITELVADKILILETKNKLFQKWFQQHDQFRIQMGCPKTMNLYSQIFKQAEQ
jgi:hypothetical protein